MTMVGGYSQEGKDTGQQFETYDNRKAKEVLYWLLEEGILPSFCTSCYRSGRSGDRFMQLAKSGSIKDVCIPNGLLTLKEYALDYGGDKFNALAETVISENLKNLNNKKLIESKLEKLQAGERDVFI